MNCDKCKFYIWYYDWCKKWQCEVDGREVHDCFEPIPTEQDQVKTPNKSPNCIGGGKRRRIEEARQLETSLLGKSHVNIAM